MINQIIPTKILKKILIILTEQYFILVVKDVNGVISGC